MRIETRPLTASDVGAAAELLAARHRRHRRTEPLLPKQFEDPGETLTEITSALQQDDASGAIAYAGGRPAGYLLGAPKPAIPWGPNVWVEQAGFALADDTDSEVARELYAAAARRWVDEGRIAHYVLVPATDRPVLDAWFRLAFGHQHTHGIREVPSERYVPPADVVIRRPDRSDIPALAAIDLALPEHQAQSPVFASGVINTLAEQVAEWEEDIDDPAYMTVVAELDGAVVGSASGCLLSLSSSHAGLARPDAAGFLGFAAVLPAARGRGVGRALGSAVLDWSRESGHACAVTDWRETNLTSSRAWTRLGYRPSYVRLHRLVGH